MDWYKHEQALYAVAKPLMRFFNMPCPRISINPQLEYAAVAYGPDRVEFQIGFVLNASYEEIVGVMKHELIHNWLIRNGYGPDSKAHGARFRAKAKAIGAVLYAKSYPGINFRIPEGWSYPERVFLRAHGYRIKE